MEVQINYLAVALATVSSMAIGYFWYAPKGFGSEWVRLAKIDPKKFKTAVAMSAAVVSSFIMAFGIAYAAFVANWFFKNDFFQDTIVTALFIFVCFQGLRMFQRAQFNQDTHAESAIHIGDEFVTVMVMASIIGLMGV